MTGRQPRRRKDQRRRVGVGRAFMVLAALVLGVIGDQGFLPAWATPWKASTSNGTSTVTATAWTSYSSTLSADPGPMNWWRLGDTSGTTASAAAGGASGTYAYSVSLNQTGALGTTDKAVAFNGTSQFVWVSSQNAFAFQGNQAFSVELWFKRTGALAASGNPRLVSKVVWSGGYNGWELAYNGASDANAGQVYCSRWANGSAAYTGSAVALTVDTWYHLVCTYDGSALRFYLNGVMTGGPSSSTGSMGTNNATLYFGCMDGSGEYARGTMDEVSLYAVKLTDRQVRAHYYAGLTGL